MSNDIAVIRSMLIYAICLPLAIFLGYLIAGPVDFTTISVIGIVLFLLVLPLLLRWYHPWLIMIWNTAVVFYFLPGTLPGWMLMSFVGFFIALGHYILNRERKFLNAPAVTWSLLFLAVVVVVTAKFRGGIGLRVLGGETMGGKRYLYLLFAILGYFALTSQAIPPKKRNLYALLFLAGGLTASISEVVTFMGPAGRIFYLLFPPSTGGAAAAAVMGEQQAISRWGGVAVACTTGVCLMLARYGIRELMDARKLWRPAAFFTMLILTMTGGYRSILILVVMTLTLVFCLEGLLRSRLLPPTLLALILCSTLMISFSDHLPLNFQRCLAFLPLKIDPIARMSAESSSDWRLEIWKSLIPQIPKYLLLGKGLGIDANDMAMYWTMGNEVGGEVGGGTTLAGDYHNGPLSLIIPFGAWGCIAFLWFLGASFRVLWANYKYGDPDAKRINTFLLSYFTAKVVMFFFVFGGFYGDLSVFVGIVGFSVSLNGGVAKPVPVPQPQVVFNRFRLLPKPAVAS